MRPSTSCLFVLGALVSLTCAAPTSDISRSSSGLFRRDPQPPASVGNDANTTPVYITKPSDGEKLIRGKPVTVSWNRPAQGVDKVDILLLKGDPSALQSAGTLATDVDVTRGTITVDLPKDVKSGSGYAIAVGKEPRLAYIGHLAIVDAPDSSSGTPPPPSQAASSTPTHNTTTDSTPTPTPTPTPAKAGDAPQGTTPGKQ